MLDEIDKPDHFAKFFARLFKYGTAPFEVARADYQQVAAALDLNLLRNPPDDIPAVVAAAMSADNAAGQRRMPPSMRFPCRGISSRSLASARCWVLQI